MINFEASLLIALSHNFYEHGFDLVLEKKQFRKKNASGFQCIIPSVSVYQQVAYIEIHLGLRHQAVEELLVQFSNHPLEYQSDTCTVLVSIGKLLNRKYFRYKAHTEADIRRIGEDIQKFMDEQGLHFLQEASKIMVLDSLLNAEPEISNIYCYNHFHRCLRGIILAKMTQNPDFERLGRIYKQNLLRHHVPLEQSRNFDKLLNFLEKFSLN
ncbi:MAG: hypothetical protein NW226_00810 [Microscillaceae bacterium]|nr:hypothetical protein [Microscillaceae bacterium]